MEFRDYLPVAVSRAVINNVRAVRRILKRYASDLPLEVVAEGRGGAGTLKLRKVQDGAEQWPSALRLDELPRQDAFPNVIQWRRAVWLLHENRGQGGLADMLLELAPHLGSPLTVQAAMFDSVGEFYCAKEWTVRRGAAEVEIKEIEALE